MKKLFVFAIMAALLVTTVMATSENKNCETSWFCNQEISTACSDFYGNAQYYTIAKWTYNDNAYVLAEQNNLYRYYNIGVSGNSNSADWTSDPRIKSVIVKTSENSTEFAGGLSGAVASTKEITDITFCGYKNGGSNGNGINSAPAKSESFGGGASNGVPVFPSFTIAIAVLAVTLGLIFIRKK
jgi:hypothetical protein